MSDMIETVAKAIYDKFEDRPAYAKRQMNGILAGELARAAIEAMREPNSQMIAAAFEQALVPVFDAKASWSAMIDAALSKDTLSLPLTPEASTPADAASPPGASAGTNSEAQP